MVPQRWLQAQFGMQQDDQGNFAVQSTAGLRRAVVKGELSVTDYYERAAGAAVCLRTGLDDGTSRTPRITDVISALSVKSPGVRVVHVASPPVDHFAAAYGDKGWGCGFRNIQMLISSLLGSTLYRGILSDVLSQTNGNNNQQRQVKGNGSSSSSRSVDAGDGGSCMPSIPRLQAAIEAAWRQGFDAAGAEQLGHRLADTRKWIGATEVYTLLTSWGLDAQIVDFHRPTGERGTHPLLVDWAWAYFSGGRGATRPPLYLQHQGHSQTIAGVERMANGSIKLLILDPSTSPAGIR
jgi:hypothetical protein